MYMAKKNKSQLYCHGSCVHDKDTSKKDTWKSLFDNFLFTNQIYSTKLKILA